MPIKPDRQYGVLRTIVALAFVSGYAAGCIFPIFKAPVTGLAVPAWVAAALCYATLIAGACCVIFVATWFVSKVGFYWVKHCCYWGAFLDFYQRRVGELARKQDTEEVP